MQSKFTRSTMMICAIILLLSGCSSAPKQQIAVATPCPEPVKIDRQLRKDLNELVKQNYRNRIYESLTK